MDLTHIHTIYFTGIKGVGMAALACIATDYGMRVLGSDVAEEFVTDVLLHKKEIEIHAGFDSQRLAIAHPDLVVYTAAHQGKQNPQIQWALTHDIPVLSQGEALGLFMSTKVGISVAGVGGKTTTTAMLTHILKSAGLHPSYMIGSGAVSGLEYPGAYDPKGEHFITEADEYVCAPDNLHPKFFYQHPKIVVLPHLAFDHPDIYKSENDTLSTFSRFVHRLPADGVLVIHTDSPLARKLLDGYNGSAKVITYGTEHGDWRLTQYLVASAQARVSISNQKEIVDYRLSTPGRHNALNAAGAILAARALGIDPIDGEVLTTFGGVERRFQKVLAKADRAIYDDYAHHPDEIMATLRAAREWFGHKQLIVIFQPHTYSRTKALFEEFAQSFEEADVVVLTDIFASAREKSDPTVSSELLARAVVNHNLRRATVEAEGPTTIGSHPLPTNQIVQYCADKAATLGFLKNLDLSNSVIFTMGAGDVYKWASDLATML